MSVAALYHHFPSKLDLLREFLHEAHDVVNGRVAREIEVAGPVRSTGSTPRSAP